MKDGFIRVAAVTPKMKVADPEYNSDCIIEKIEEVVQTGSRIIVFPELCITGYTCGDLFLQDELLCGARLALERIVRATKTTAAADCLIFVGLPLEISGRLYNTAAAIFGGRIIAFIPKANIPEYGEFYEKRHFTQGSAIARNVFFDEENSEVPFGTDILIDLSSAIRGLKVACEICEDAWVPDAPDIRHALAGATVIVNLSASNDIVGKAAYRRQLIASISARLITGYIYASSGNGESTQDIVFGGHNIIAENGDILSQSRLFENGIVFSEIDIFRLLHERRRMTTFGPEEGHLIAGAGMTKADTAISRSFPGKPFVPADSALRNERCEEILAIQVNGLRKRYEHTGSRTAVVGVSGGLDSTLALLVTVRAFDLLGLDRRGILAVTMPCFGTTDRTYSNACTLAETLGVTLREVNIRNAVGVHFTDIGQDSEIHDVTYENCQARERTQVLMDIANKEGGMVIGTGDLSELALGWATYNGDHMSMYGVNSGVPKTLVRHLVRYCADTASDTGMKTVLMDVLDTPVSPELIPPVDGKISQKTEDLVGPYELHDFFLYYMLRFGFSPKKIFRLALLTFEPASEHDEKSYDRQTVLKWLESFYRRFFAQQFKRSCLPDGPKVGSVAVSPRGDLRMPSDASVRLWMSEIESLKKEQDFG